MKQAAILSRLKRLYGEENGRKLIKSDWKTFQSMVPELRERYLTEKNKEIVAIFMDEGRTPTERFWDARREWKKKEKFWKTVLTDIQDQE